MYSYKQFGNTFVVSIESGQNLTDALLAFVKQNDITGGEITGLGAVSIATLRFFNPTTKLFEDRCFNQQMEIANLTGNISVMDGQPYLHLHITLGTSDFSTISGHLLTAQINGACELFIRKTEATLYRYRDNETGLNLYDLSK